MVTRGAELQFKISPDYELKIIYETTIKVTDDEGLNISQDLTVDIKNVAPKNDIPTITSSDGFPNKHVIWDANLQFQSLFMILKLFIQIQELFWFL